MTITDSTTIAEIVKELPGSVPVFQKHKIDFCCGGRRSLASVCDDLGLPLDQLTEEVRRAGEKPAPDTRDWNSEPLHALTLHIVGTYHQPLREELPRLQAMADKVVSVHVSHEPRLQRLRAILNDLAADLLDHMAKEEHVLFPAISMLEHGVGRPPVWGPIAVMEQEHQQAGAMLAELSRLTDRYTPPEWACGTLTALYGGLRQFDEAMQVHVHLENNILFPRASALANSRH